MAIILDSSNSKVSFHENRYRIEDDFNQSVTRPEIFDRVREFWVASLGGESGSGNFQILFPPPSPSPGISSRKKRVRDQIFGVKNNKMTCKSIENYKSFQSSLVS